MKCLKCGGTLYARLVITEKAIRDTDILLDHMPSPNEIIDAINSSAGESEYFTLHRIEVECENCNYYKEIEVDDDYDTIYALADDIVNILQGSLSYSPDDEVS